MITNYYVGLMSGTSMDAIDAVLIDFAEKSMKVIADFSLTMPKELKSDLVNLTQGSFDDIHLMGKIDHQLGILFAKTVQGLLEKANVAFAEVIGIGSHGQTIRHFPNIEFPYTLQIADPNIIAALTQITTVADFRRKDLALGGQGAPLTPAFHEFIFRDTTKNRFVVNLGGIANVTLIASEIDKPIVGFDTGPANILLDTFANLHLKQDFDHDGLFAKAGIINQDLLKKLLEDPYFSLPFPKSTGREYFNLDWLNQHLDTPHEAPENIQATLTELTAQSIYNAISQFQLDNAEIILCGGGINNLFLVERLSKLANPIPVFNSNDFGLHPQLVEASAFAWFAKQTLERKSSNLPSVTGAKKAAVLGGIYLP